MICLCSGVFLDRLVILKFCFLVWVRWVGLMLLMIIIVVLSRCVEVVVVRLIGLVLVM